MIIKESASHTLSKKRGPLFYLGVGSAFVFLCLASMEYGRKLAIEHRFIPFRHILGNALKTKGDIIANFFRGLFSRPDHLLIDIKHENFQRLAFQREQALSQGKLETVSDESYVPGKIRFNGKTLPMEIRLKGDDVDHLSNEKWSFRIKLNGNNSLYGMGAFSIHHPWRRNYLYEWLYHQALAREGVLTTRYHFVKVLLNGKNLGIYALEEHFQKNLIEHNKNIEGPILKFDETAYWADYVYSGGTGNETGLATEAASVIDAFGMESIKTDPLLYERFLLGRNLLESFRNKKLPTHKVFDIKKMAAFLALSDLMSASHALIWHNLRFYYNPLTSLIEPIGFDGNAATPTDHGLLIGVYYRRLDEDYRSFYEYLFEDQRFFEEYLKAADRISKPQYLDSLFSEIREELEKNRNVLNKEFFYIHFSKDLFYQNQEKIQKALKPVKLLHAYYQRSSDDSVFLTLSNVQSLPLEILYLSHKKTTLAYPAQKTILPSKKTLSDHDSFQEIQFSLPQGLNLPKETAKDLVLHAKVLGSSDDNAMEVEVFPWPSLDPKLLKADLLRKTPNAEVFPFLKRDELTKRIFIQPGSWTIKENLIIPADYSFVATGGTNLDLRNNANIISYSPLTWEGRIESPIRIRSSDATGGGLIVLKANRLSVLKHVFFTDLKSPKETGWDLTGAITFYESPVHILHSEFRGLHPKDDGLNIVRSDFKIDHGVFADLPGDAFDSDFTKGQITHSSFEKIGGDAVDASGSEITLQNNSIRDVRDKGVSLGERSFGIIKELKIERAGIGIAVKDQSKADLENITIEDSPTGIAVFQKKPEFGPASAVARNLTLKQVHDPYMIEKDSFCQVDDRILQPDQKNIKKKFY